MYLTINLSTGFLCPYKILMAKKLIQFAIFIIPPIPLWIHNDSAFGMILRAFGYELIS